MISAILQKLESIITTGLSSEAEAVYLLVGIRKILEQTPLNSSEYLKFHCDWAVHHRLKGTFAQWILDYFDQAHPHLRNGLALHQLPNNLGQQIQEIFSMSEFRAELSNFLKHHGLTDFTAIPNGWPHFLHLYAKITEDCPLVIRADNQNATIKSVITHVEMGSPIQGWIPYRIKWEVTDDSPTPGILEIYYSFQDPAKPEADNHS